MHRQSGPDRYKFKLSYRWSRPVLTKLQNLDRTALRRAYREDEQSCVKARVKQAEPASVVHDQAADLAGKLIVGARKEKASGIDAFLHQYGLDTEEGIALMCLAEALLRVPDAETADLLIRDKLGDIDWSEHLGESSSTFVNAATFSLMLTGEVLDPPEAKQRGMGATLKRTMNRLGEPVVRKATLQAMRILGRQFVYGRTIDEAMDRAKPEQKKGLSHSFDMLGEAALTGADAERLGVLRVDDGVAADGRTHRPGELEIPPLGVGRPDGE